MIRSSQPMMLFECIPVWTQARMTSGLEIIRTKSRATR